MNCGDVFILDAGPTIFVWRGSQSSLAEKREAARLADVLKDKPGEKVRNILSMPVNILMTYFRLSLLMMVQSQN